MTPQAAPASIVNHVHESGGGVAMSERIRVGRTHVKRLGRVTVSWRSIVLAETQGEMNGVDVDIDGVRVIAITGCGTPSELLRECRIDMAEDALWYEDAAQDAR